MITILAFLSSNPTIALIVLALALVCLFWIALGTGTSDKITFRDSGNQYKL